MSANTSQQKAPKIAIIFYSVSGHIEAMAKAVLAGIEGAEGQATVFQVPETLPAEVLEKIHKKSYDYPVATAQTLVDYDAFLFGVPTRYGNMPAQWKAFWDATGKLWMGGDLDGKYAGIFVSTSSPGGGQEMTASNCMSTLVHHGINFVPFGYKSGLEELMSFDEVHGGSPWGAGTLTKPDGRRFPSERELKMAKAQGSSFYKKVSRVNF